MSSRDDLYLLPNGTLRNKLGITDQQRLSEAEYELVAARELGLRGRLPGPPFTFDTLKSIHRELFQDVYEWAGQPRTTPISKREFDHPASPVQTFARPDSIVAQADAAFSRFAAAGNSIRRSPADFVAGATDLFADVNRVHFAREGNGRSQRLLLTAIGASAGYPLDFDVLSRERMVAVSVQAHKGDTSGIRRMFEEIIDPRRVGAMRRAISALRTSRVAWNDLYVATTRAGETYDGMLVGRAGSDFMMQVDQAGETRILIGDTVDVPASAGARSRISFVATRFSLPQPLAPQAKKSSSRVVGTILKRLEPSQPDKPLPWAPAPAPMAKRLADLERTKAEARKPGPAAPDPEPDASLKPSSAPKP